MVENMAAAIVHFNDLGPLDHIFLYDNVKTIVVQYEKTFHLMCCISLYGKYNLRKKQNGRQDAQSKNAFLLILDLIYQ